MSRRYHHHSSSGSFGSAIVTLAGLILATGIVLICLGTGYDLCGGSYLDPKDQVYCNRTLGDKHTSIKISVNDSAPSGLTSYIFTKKPKRYMEERSYTYNINNRGYFSIPFHTAESQTKFSYTLNATRSIDIDFVGIPAGQKSRRYIHQDSGKSSYSDVVTLDQSYDNLEIIFSSTQFFDAKIDMNIAWSLWDVFGATDKCTSYPCKWDFSDSRFTSTDSYIVTHNTGRKYYAIRNELNVLRVGYIVGGAVIQWIRDQMRFIVDAPDSEYFATKIEDNGGVYLVPAFTGLGAPYWDMYARGTMFGITRGTTINHIIRASLESIAYQVTDLILSMKDDTKFNIKEMKVDGGASSNDFLMQFQSDISEINVIRNKDKESTSLGAFYLAGLGVKLFSSFEDIKLLVHKEKEYTPKMSVEKKRENKKETSQKKRQNGYRRKRNREK